MNIELRRLQMRDLYKLTELIDKDSAELANITWPFTRSVATEFIENFNTWGVWTGGNRPGTLVGVVEIKEDCETAYLVHRNWRNAGIATFAVQLIKEKFADKQLWCLIKPENRASLRVAEKANMRIVYYNNQ